MTKNARHCRNAVHLTFLIILKRPMPHRGTYPLALHLCRDVPARCSSFRRPAGALIIPLSGFSERALLFDKNDVAAELIRASGAAAETDDVSGLSAGMRTSGSGHGWPMSREASKHQGFKEYGPESAKQGPGEKFPGLGRRGLPRKGYSSAVSAGWLLK